MAAALLGGFLLDALLGEPRHWHPLVGFGRLAAAFEQRLNRGSDGPGQKFRAGLLAWLMLVVPGPLLLLWLGWWLPESVAWSLGALVVYICLGGRSLALHGKSVAEPLLRGDLVQARGAVAMLVSRDCQAMDGPAITRAAVESVLENGNDAVVATLFWFAVAGPPGALLHRLANTLDACWGYRNQRFLYFGRCAARADDLLNYVPARLCALAYSLAGATRSAVDCWWSQGGQLASPNGGPVMSAGAGALQVYLGGQASYGGRMVSRPRFGCGREACAGDIDRAVQLLWRASVIVVAVILVVEVVWR